MSVEHLFEGVRHSGDLVGAAELQYVWLWDTGPKRPEQPKRPVPPAILKTGREGEGEFDLAKLEFAEILAEYEAARTQYKAELKAFADWNKKYGGPFEMRFWSCDASDALARDKRYCISARTRGHQQLKNGGLPEGMKPGRAHHENIRREEAGEADMAAARRRDPVFGEQEIRA